MIPLCLVAGFLGAGKTSLLKNFLVRMTGKKVVFLINEFADGEIDASLIAQAGGMARAVSGGSVFCVCKADEFKDMLIDAAAVPGLDGVVVEASGMAEPRAMGKILSDPRIADKYILTSLIAVVDPRSYSKLSYTLPAICGQVAEADYIVVNKRDLLQAEDLERVERQLRDLNPAAALVITTMAETDIDPLAPVAGKKHKLAAELTTCGGRDFTSFLVSFSNPIPSEDFVAAIKDLGNLVARVKGWLNTTDRARQFVELTAGGEISMQPSPAGDTRIVVIVGMNAMQAARNRLSRISGCTFSE